MSKRISISERSVQYLIETYMLLVTGVKQDKDYLDEVISPEGIILSIDGIQPEKGNEVYPSGCAFRGSARLILWMKHPSKKVSSGIEFYPILGVISDGQDTIRKAVSSFLPDIPLCHYH